MDILEAIYTFSNSPVQSLVIELDLQLFYTFPSRLKSSKKTMKYTDEVTTSVTNEFNDDIP